MSTEQEERERIMQALLVFYTEERVIDVMNRGEYNRVWQVLDALDSGAYL